MDCTEKYLFFIRCQVTKLSCSIRSTEATQSLLNCLRAKGRARARFVKMVVGTQLKISVPDAEHHPLHQLEIADMHLGELSYILFHGYIP